MGQQTAEQDVAATSAGRAGGGGSMPHSDDVLPTCSWDELLTTVRARAATLLRVRRAIDPSPQRLQAFLPYSPMPPGVDLRRKLGSFSGESWIQHLGRAEIRVDRASTTRALDGTR